jgi:hypothetical protein
MFRYIRNLKNNNKIGLVLLALFFTHNSHAQKDILTPIVGCSASSSSSYDICSSEKKVYFATRKFEGTKTIHSYDILAKRYDSIQVALPFIEEHFKYSLLNTIGVYKDSLIVLGFGDYLFSVVFDNGSWSDVRQHHFREDYIEYCLPIAVGQVKLVLKDKRDRRFIVTFDTNKNLIINREQLKYPFLFLSHLGPSRYFNQSCDTVYKLRGPHYEIKGYFKGNEELSINLRPYFKTKNSSYIERIEHLSKLESKMRQTMIELDSLNFDFLEELYVSNGIYYIVYSMAGTGGKNTKRAVLRLDLRGNLDLATHYILERKKVNILSPYFFSIGGELYSLAIIDKRIHVASLSGISR